MEQEYKPGNLDEELVGPLPPEFFKNILEGLTMTIDQLFVKNPDREIIFIVGGKSRQLVEWFLEACMAQLPQDHPAQTSYRQRIRLNNKENKELQGDTPSSRINGKVEIQPSKMPESLLRYFTDDEEVSNKLFVYIDDHIGSGRKAMVMSEEFARQGKSFKFLSLTAQPGEYGDAIVAFPDFHTYFVIQWLSGILSFSHDLALQPQNYDESDFKNRRTGLHMIRDFRARLKRATQ